MVLLMLLTFSCLNFVSFQLDCGEAKQRKAVIFTVDIDRLQNLFKQTEFIGCLEVRAYWLDVVPLVLTDRT